MIILTGGAGFIGSAFLWKLNKKGINDIIIVDKLRKTDKWKNLRNKFFSDYIDKDKFLELLENNKFKNIDTIFHIGACSSTTEKDADYIMSNNFVYSRRIAEWCVENNTKMIYASSAAAYGNGDLGYHDDHESLIDLQPMNVYGYSKYLFDLWVYKNKLFDKITGFKYFNVFGPNEYHKNDMKSVICKAYNQINTTGHLKLFKSYKDGIDHGEQKRDFVYIKDVLDVMFYFYENKNIGGVFNLGTGKAGSFKDLGIAVFKAMGLKPKIKYIPMPLNLRDRYQYFTEADLTKLKKAGYDKNFYTLEDSISDYVKSYLSQENPFL